MLWINTGTLCNITCANCYIESSPRNDALAFISAGEVAALLDEAATPPRTLQQVGFTGGEPFLNRDLPAMLQDVLGRGLQALVLTNAMKPMLRQAEALRALAGSFGERLVLRVSLDHHDAARHDAERGPGNFEQVMAGLAWLVGHGVHIRIAGRAGLTGGERGGAAPGFRAPVRGARHPAGRRRSAGAGAVPGNGRGGGCAGDHHRLLGHPAQAPRRSDVRERAHGGEAQGRGAARRGRLHPAAL